MNSKYEYDTSGVSSSLLGIGLLLPIVIATYSRAFPKKKTFSYPCSCNDCLQRRKEKRRINIFRVLFVSAVLLLLLPLKNALFKEYNRAGSFDPYQTLGVSKYANKKQIEKAYRLRVRESKIKIKDKKESNEAVQLIQKAHQTLADAKLREKWDTFGEEEKRDKHVVAIPEWLMTRNSSLLFLLGYIILLGVIVPKAVSSIWKITFNYSIVGLSYRSTETLYQEMKYIKKCFSIHTLIEWISSSCTELHQHKWKTPSENTSRISQRIQENIGIFLKEENSSLPYVISYGVFCLRDEEILSLIHEEDIEYAQSILLKGARGVRAISLALKQKEIYYLSFELERSLIQAVPDPKYWQLQYPDTSFEEVFIKFFEGRKFEEEKSEVAQRVDSSMFKAKITAITLYTPVDGVITKEEFISGEASPVLRVVVTRENVKSSYAPPVSRKTRKQDADYSDLSLLEEDEHSEHSPKDLDKSPVLLRHAEDSPLHAPFFKHPQTYLWLSVVEINGNPVMESPEFTPGTRDTEIFFKLPPLNSLIGSSKAIIDVRLFSTNFFSRESLQRKTVTLK